MTFKVFFSSEIAYVYFFYYFCMFFLESLFECQGVYTNSEIWKHLGNII